MELKFCTAANPIINPKANDVEVTIRLENTFSSAVANLVRKIELNQSLEITDPGTI